MLLCSSPGLARSGAGREEAGADRFWDAPREKALYSLRFCRAGAHSGKTRRVPCPALLSGHRAFFPSGWGSLGVPRRWPRGFSEPLLQCLSPPSPGGFGQLHPKPDSVQAARHPPSRAQSCSPLPGPPHSPPAPLGVPGEHPRAMLAFFPPSPLAVPPCPKLSRDLGLLGGPHRQHPPSPRSSCARAVPAPGEEEEESWGEGDGGADAPRRSGGVRPLVPPTPEPLTPSTGCFSRRGWMSGSTGGAQGPVAPQDPCPGAGDPRPCPPGS